MNLNEARRLWHEERREWEARVIALRLALGQTLGALDSPWGKRLEGVASRDAKIKRAQEIGYAALDSAECQLPDAPDEPITAESSIYRLPGVNVRDLNSLERHGYRTIADVLATSRPMLILHVNNFNIRGLASVEQSLAQLGIDWPEDPELSEPSQLAGTLHA